MIQIQLERDMILEKTQFQKSLETRIKKTENLHEKLSNWRNQRIIQMKCNFKKREDEMKEEARIEAAIDYEEELKRSTIKEKIINYHKHLTEESKILKQMQSDMAFKTQAEKIVRNKVNFSL
jgi:hypothetical protein